MRTTIRIVPRIPLGAGEGKNGHDGTHAGPCCTVVICFPFQGQGVSKHDAPETCGLAGSKLVKLRVGEGPLAS
jgi:hypothetical protein